MINIFYRCAFVGLLRKYNDKYCLIKVTISTNINRKQLQHMSLVMHVPPCQTEVKPYYMSQVVSATSLVFTKNVIDGVLSRGLLLRAHLLIKVSKST